MSDRLDVVILGLSITSSWGNGHATTCRGLVRALSAMGHRVPLPRTERPLVREQPRPAPLPGLRVEHLPPGRHAAFYCAQRYTLNVPRADMIRAGHSPPVRLFEAAAFPTPVISDRWPGLESYFTPGREILLAGGSAETLAILGGMAGPHRRALGELARRRVPLEHTASHRAEALLCYLAEARERRALARAPGRGARPGRVDGGRAGKERGRALVREEGT